MKKENTMSGRRLSVFFFVTLLITIAMRTHPSPGLGDGSFSTVKQQQITVRVGFYENPPKLFTAEDGTIQGFWPDLVHAIANEEGWEVIWVPGSWEENLARLESGEIDIMPDVAWNQARSQTFDFADEKVLVSWSRLYAHTDENIETILDLEGKTVAGLTGSVNYDGAEGVKDIVSQFDIQVTFLDLNNYTEVFEAIQNGSADAGVTNKDFGNQNERNYNNIERTPFIFQPAYITFAFPKNRTLTPRLIEVMNAHIHVLKSDNDSIYYQSLHKHLEVEAAETTQTVEVMTAQERNILFGGAGVILFLLATSYIFRREVQRQTAKLQNLNAELEERVRDRTEELNERLKMETQLNLDMANMMDDLKDSNTQLKKITRKLTTANKELETFAYSISHDLRAPLRAVTGFSEIISRRHRSDLNEEGQRYFDNIVQASKRMSTLIDDLLAYSRLGRGSLKIESISMQELCASLNQDFAVRLKELGATLTIAEDLPIVQGNRALLNQIFDNLLGNALKYYKPNTLPHIQIDWRSDGDTVILSIGDNGIGIPAEHHEKIFNIFQRLQSEEDYPGTGIGLASVKKSTDLLGGEVWVESEVGKGSTFYVRLAAG